MAFIVNIAFAVWMKFDRGGSQLTPILCTIVLALSLCGMLQSTKSWAGHLFQSTSSQARMQANRIAAATKPSGLPFDWHRVPSAEPDQETSCSVFVDMVRSLTVDTRVVLHPDAERGMGLYGRRDSWSWCARRSCRSCLTDLILPSPAVLIVTAFRQMHNTT